VTKFPLGRRLGLCWRILREKPDNLLDHARRELPQGDADDRGMQALLNQGIEEMVLVFSTQGHSGMSAPYAINILNEVLRFKPLGPLTGEDSEWNEVSSGADPTDMKWQNRRCGHVFKRADGTAYDSEGRVFREPDGGCYTSLGSRVDITFPYTPKTEYVDRPAVEESPS
jgi:hypothetical protein